MSNPGSKGALGAFLATMSITGNPTVDAAIRYALFGVGTFVSGAVIGWLNSKGFSGPDLMVYVPMGVLAGLFALATMVWGLVKTSKNEFLVQLREALAVKAGIAAAESRAPTPEVVTISDAQKVIAQASPDDVVVEKEVSWLWGLLKAALPFILGLFGFAPKKNQSDIDRAAGEEFGRAKQNAEAAERMLDDAKKAVDAGRDAAAADAGDGVRKPRPGDREWNPDGLE